MKRFNPASFGTGMFGSAMFGMVIALVSTNIGLFIESAFLAILGAYIIIKYQEKA